MVGDKHARSTAPRGKVRWYGLTSQVITLSHRCADAAHSTCKAGGCLSPDSAGVGRGFVWLCLGAERSLGGDAIPAAPQVQPWFHLVANWQNFSAGALPVTSRCSNLQPAPVHSCL